MARRFFASLRMTTVAFRLFDRAYFDVTTILRESWTLP